MIGYQLQLDQKIYFKETSSDYRIYFSPGLKYRYREYVGPNYTDKLRTYAVQMVGGLKYVYLNRYVVDFYFGGRVDYSIIEKNSTNVNRYRENYLNPGFSGVAPVINCTFGFKF
jgi:hypothetical protein